MSYRRVILCALLAASLARTALAAPATAPASQPAASRPAASQPAIPSDPVSIREMISRIGASDAVIAADAVVQLKWLALRRVPVWDFIEDTDPVSAQQLLTWLRDHPGNIHHPSSLRVQWEALKLYNQDLSSGKVWLMSDGDLIEYGKLVRELLRDGDPYGYWALLDVCRTATEVLGQASDHATFPYAMPFLQNHLDSHVIPDALKGWKGYWSKPITQKRKYRSPISPPDSDGTPIPLEPPYEIPARLLLRALDAYQAHLVALGLWQMPPWEKQFTDKTTTADLLHGMIGAPFPVRQHLNRLLRDRLADREVRKQLVEAIQQNHPYAQVLQLLLEQTTLMPYGDALRKAWPRQLEEQCPGALEDALSSNPRRQLEAAYLTQTTLFYWPDRDWANRTALEIWQATGEGNTDFSVVVLLTVDNKQGVDRLLEIYRKGEIPDAAYNGLHRWVNTGAAAFRTLCADKDLAPVILKATTATQPAIDTSKADWSQVLRMAYELYWWRLNSDKLYWNEKTHRLEVPQDQLAHPTEAQIVEAYQDRGKLLREIRDESKTRKVKLR